MTDLVQTSKFLSLVLRHAPERIGLVLDSQGWVDIDELLRCAAAHGARLDRSTLDRVVYGNDKQRFAFSPDGRRIRASQGHSVAVDLALPPREPPEVLFHGTATRFLAVRDGRLYYRAHGLDKAEKNLLILDEATGRTLAGISLESPALQFSPAEDRLLTIRDASHSETELALLATDVARFRPPEGFYPLPHENTTAYEVYMEPPYVDGFLYLRTKDGRIACYDLRAK